MTRPPVMDGYFTDAKYWPPSPTKLYGVKQFVAPKHCKGCGRKSVFFNPDMRLCMACVINHPDIKRQALAIESAYNREKQHALQELQTKQQGA